MDSQQLGVIGILKEAACIPLKNKNLMLPIILLSTLSSSLLSLGNYVSIYPLLLNFIIKLYVLNLEDPSTPQFFDAIVGIKADAEDFLHIYKVFIVASYLFSLLFILLVVQASAITYSGKELTLEDLLKRIRGSWKAVLVTKVHFTFLYIGYTILSVSLIAVFMLDAEGSVVWIAMSGILGLSARVFYVYLGMVWMVGLVMSVLEDGCWGLEALSRAGEVVKGRRLQGFAIATILLVAEGVFTGGYGLGIGKSLAQGERVGVTGVIVVIVLQLLKVLSMTVYTVFYCECRVMNHKQGEFTYSRVRNSSVTHSEDEAVFLQEV